MWHHPKAPHPQTCWALPRRDRARFWGLWKEGRAPGTQPSSTPFGLSLAAARAPPLAGISPWRVCACLSVCWFFPCPSRRKVSSWHPRWPLPSLSADQRVWGLSCHTGSRCRLSLRTRLTWAGRGQALAVTALAALPVHKMHRGAQDWADPACGMGTGKVPGQGVVLGSPSGQGGELGVTAGWVRVGISIGVWVNVRVRVRVGDAPRLSCMGRAGLT